MELHTTTQAQWLSSQYLTQLTQGNKGIAFADNTTRFYACEQRIAGVSECHVLGQYLSLEKLSQVWHSLNPVLPLNGFFARTTAFGTSFYADVQSHNGFSISQINQIIEKVTEDLSVDIAILEQAPTLAKPGLLVMDMDSTVIQVECIDEIAKLSGVGEQVSQVTALAMQGKLDFQQSLTQRVACLEGTPVDVLKQVCERLPLMPGLENLVTRLQKAHWKVAIASGGFTFFADYLKQRLGLDAAVSNTLEIEGDYLTGKVVGQIIDAQVKADTLVSLASQYGIDKSQTIAMGDGANDLVMMQQAALGVGCHAKPLVRQEADCAIRYAGLDALIAMLKSE